LLGKWFPQPQGYRRAGVGNANAGEDEQYEWHEVGGVHLRIPPNVDPPKPVPVSNSFQILQDSSSSDAVGSSDVDADVRLETSAGGGHAVADESEVYTVFLDEVKTKKKTERKRTESRRVQQMERMRM